jgi:DNA invertase Pin-like site-specific DNA recombinase
MITEEGRPGVGQLGEFLTRQRLTVLVRRLDTLTRSVLGRS